VFGRAVHGRFKAEVIHRRGPWRNFHAVEQATRRMGRAIGRMRRASFRPQQGGLNTKLHAVAEAKGGPLKVFVTAGQIRDDKGVAARLQDFPKAEWRGADKGYDAGWIKMR
jgi:hypothetical protein